MLYLQVAKGWVLDEIFYEYDYLLHFNTTEHPNLARRLKGEYDGLPSERIRKQGVDLSISWVKCKLYYIQIEV